MDQCPLGGIDQPVRLCAVPGLLVIMCLETAAQRRGGFGARLPGNPAPIPSPSLIRPPPSHPGWTGSHNSFESPRPRNEPIVAYPVPYPVYVGSENPPGDPPYGGESPPLSPLYPGPPPDPIMPAPYAGPPLQIHLDAQPTPSQSATQRSGGEGCRLPDMRDSTAVEEVADRVEFFIALKDH